MTEFTPQQQEVYDWSRRVLSEPEVVATPEFLEFALRMRPAMIADHDNKLRDAIAAARSDAGYRTGDNS